MLNSFTGPSLATPGAAERAAPGQESPAFRLAAWAVLYAVAAVAAVRPVTDYDVWWHLSVGQWVVEHQTVPVTDPFSRYGQDKPWVAYSWLFEVLVYGLHQGLGLFGIVAFRVALSLAVLAAVHRLVARREPRFLWNVGLVGAAALALIPMFNERPWLFTILFSTLTLDAVLDLREGRRGWTFWALPVIFALWANIHIQFVYGLFVLALGCAAPWADRRFGCEGAEGVRPGTAGYRNTVVLAVGCALATLLNPYHVRLYGVVLEYATQPAPMRIIVELRALDFRDVWDWAVLAFALAAAFALGRRGKWSSFDLLLLGGAAFFSFRMKRDLWFVVVAALAVLTAGPRVVLAAEEVFAWTRRRVAVLAAALAVVIGVAVMTRDALPDRLRSRVEEKFPAAAAARVAELGCDGPLYNQLNWGGYLIWALPHLPVAIDGRTNLHGDDRMVRSERTWAGMAGWDSDPELQAAGVVIADAKNAGLTSLLRRDPGYYLLFEDEVAVVFVARANLPRRGWISEPGVAPAHPGNDVSATALPRRGWISEPGVAPAHPGKRGM